MKILLSLLLITGLSWTSIEDRTVTIEEKDIVATAAASDELSTLVSAIKASGLASSLEGDGPFTLFAPSNEAFAALPDNTMANLLDPSNKQQLVTILTYHVLSEEASAADLSDGTMMKTINGDKVTITKQGDSYSINGAKISSTDIIASNGIIHIIDQVLLPADM